MTLDQQFRVEMRLQQPFRTEFMGAWCDWAEELLGLWEEEVEFLHMVASPEEALYRTERMERFADEQRYELHYLNWYGRE